MLRKLFFFLVIVVFVFCGGMVSADTILNPGDVVITVVNADGAFSTVGCPDPSSKNNGFEFVNRVNIESGTVLYITDNARTGGGFNNNEGTIVFTATNFIAAGTKTYYNDCVLVSSPSQWSRVGGRDPATAGENLLIYQGSINSGATANFIYGVGWRSATPWIVSGLPTTNNSYLPSLLTLGSTALSLGTNRNYQYAGANCDISSLTFLADVANSGNWVGNGGASAGTPYGSSTCTYFESISPVVTLSGLSDIIVSQGIIYTDAGAGWTDNIDGSGNILTGIRGTTGSFAVSGTVDTMVLGVYFIEYRKIDNAGNTGNIVTRTVTVIDDTIPSVILSGASTVTIAQGGVYSEVGASWMDNVDGSGTVFGGVYGGTGSFQVSGTVNTSVIGTYLLEYRKVDNSGNMSIAVTRIVNVTDQSLPVVTLSGNNSITIKRLSTYTDAGAGWTDNVDGSGNILTGIRGDAGSFVMSGTVDTSITGIYFIEYQKIDNAGNIGTIVIRTVIVEDLPPVVTLSGNNSITLNWGDSYIEEGAVSMDDVEGLRFISSANSGSVDSYMPGIYVLEYRYIDTNGNQSNIAIREVTVSNPGIPVAHDDYYTGNQGTIFYNDTLLTSPNINDQMQYVVSGGIVSGPNHGSVVNSGHGFIYYPNTGYAGIDQIVYELCNILNQCDDAIIYIYMVDTTSPVVSLNGISVININQGGIFTDPGASWSDNVDGSGTNVVVSGSIDTNTVGTYILTYTYTDVGGNTGNTVLRTVNVVSTPITLSSEGGGAGLAKDSCPNGDYSSSYYDAQCGNKPKVESGVFEGITTTISSCQEPDYKLASFQDLKKLSQRKQFIVCRLYKNKQTIFDNVPEFDYNRMVTREEASKMIGRFVKNILNKEPIRKKSDKKCNFIDLNQSNPYLVDSIKESCLYGVFNGTSSNKFLPKQNLTQAHAIATVLRSSYGYQDENGNTPWFSPYIKLLRDKNLGWKTFSTYDSISLEQEGISRGDLGELMYRVAVDIFDHK